MFQGVGVWVFVLNNANNEGLYEICISIHINTNIVNIYIYVKRKMERQIRRHREMLHMSN